MTYHFRYGDGEPQADLSKPHGVEGRYWNTGHSAVAIVARLNPGFDWSAYVGSASSLTSEEQALVLVAALGAKLTEAEARFFFPDIEEPYRE